MHNYKMDQNTLTLPPSSSLSSSSSRRPTSISQHKAGKLTTRSLQLHNHDFEENPILRRPTKEHRMVTIGENNLLTFNNATGGDIPMKTSNDRVIGPVLKVIPNNDFKHSTSLKNNDNITGSYKDIIKSFDQIDDVHKNHILVEDTDEKEKVIDLKTESNNHVLLSEDSKLTTNELLRPPSSILDDLEKLTHDHNDLIDKRSHQIQKRSPIKDHLNHRHILIKLPQLGIVSDSKLQSQSIPQNARQLLQQQYQLHVQKQAKFIQNKVQGPKLINHINPLDGRPKTMQSMEQLGNTYQNKNKSKTLIIVPYNIMIAAKPSRTTKNISNIIHDSKSTVKNKPRSSKLISQMSNHPKQLHLPNIDNHHLHHHHLEHHLQHEQPHHDQQRHRRHTNDKKVVNSNNVTSEQHDFQNDQAHSNDLKFKKHTDYDKPMFMSHQNLNIPDNLISGEANKKNLAHSSTITPFKVSRRLSNVSYLSLQHLEKIRYKYGKPTTSKSYSIR